MIVTLISFVTILLVCVVVHEAGHYKAARICGVHVHEFSFGMGPLVAQRRGRYTRWSLRLLPIGGFVRMAGMGEEHEDESVPAGAGFLEKGSWQRLFILLAGPMANLLLAVVLSAFIQWGMGVYDLSRSEVGGLLPGFPAESAGLRVGDRVVSVDGQETVDWVSMTRAIQKHRPGTAVVLRVLRNGRRLTFTIVPKIERPEGSALVGIQPVRVKPGPVRSMLDGVSFTAQLSWAMVKGLGQMLQNPLGADVTGPVGIAVMAGDAARHGFWALLIFLSIISLNLGIVNLLPFPALDGGRILFILIELIAGRSIPERLEGRIHLVGFVILVGLILAITWHDVLRLVVGGSRP